MFSVLSALVVVALLWVRFPMPGSQAGRDSLTLELVYVQVHVFTTNDALS